MVYLRCFLSTSAGGRYCTGYWERCRCVPRFFIFLIVAVSFPAISIFYFISQVFTAQVQQRNATKKTSSEGASNRDAWQLRYSDDIQVLYCVCVTFDLLPASAKPKANLWNRTRINLEHINSSHGKLQLFPAAFFRFIIFFLRTFVYLLIVYSVFFKFYFYFAKRCICKTLLLYIEKHL